MSQRSHEGQTLKIQNVSVSELKAATYNPRKWSEDAVAGLTASIKQFGLVDPILVNGAGNRSNVVIGGHFRLKVAKDLGYKTVPVVYVDIPDEAKEKELNLRLNRNLGDWDYELLAEFDESLLTDVGFDSEELDAIFDLASEEPENFDLEKELAKLDINKITVQKGDVYQLGDSRLMVGDSTIEADMTKLMNGQQADMCMTDPPYILDYLNAKRHGKPTEGFGSKRNLYSETVQDIVSLKSRHTSADIYIEDVGMQRAIIEMLTQENMRAEAVPLNGRDKEERLQVASFWILNGTVQFPREGCKKLLEQVIGFGVERDDLLDALTLGVIYMMEHKNKGSGITIGRASDLFGNRSTTYRRRSGRDYWNRRLSDFNEATSGKWD